MKEGTIGSGEKEGLHGTFIEGKKIYNKKI